MKVLLLSRYGDGLDLAIDFKRDGHDVRCWIQDPKRRHEIFEGLVEKVDDFKDAKGWAELAVFDANHMTDEWAVVSKWGIPVWGGSPRGEQMEQDRDFAHGLMEKVGLKRFESETFKTIDEAIKHLKKHQVLHVSKTVGGDADSHDVVISKHEDGADAIDRLELYKKSGKKYDEVEVEERIIGVEAGVAGYFNGKDWIGPIEINFQFKETAASRPGSDRGLGFLCGETGTVLKYVTQENEFFKKTLGLFTEHLRKIDYHGELDLGTMTNENGIFPIEFTPRFGYPDLFIRRALSKTPQIDLFAAGAAGKDIDFKTLPGWGIGYLVMVPGFPDQDSVEKHSSGVHIFGYDEKNPNMHLMEVKKVGDLPEIAKGCGYAAVVTGRGATIEAAQRNAYWWFHEANNKCLEIHGSWVREDIGERVLAQKEEIIELGILSEAEWSGE